MNSRQRRGVILLLLSVICAVAAFVGVLSVDQQRRLQGRPRKDGVRAEHGRRRLQSAGSRAVREGEDAASAGCRPTAVTDLGKISGKIAVTPLKKGSLLQDDMIVARPALKAGQQEIAIMIDAETGVAGKINPGARVNIFATFEGKRPEDKPGLQDHRRRRPGHRRRQDHAPGGQDPGDTTSRPAGRRGRPDHLRAGHPGRPTGRLRRVVRLARTARPGRPRQRATVPPGQRTYTLDGDK